MKAPRARRVLHVAALPFPSPQGTQAALHAMLQALSEGGVETHLLCYAHGAPLAQRRRYQVHRLEDFPRLRSLASGPSLAKLVLDARLPLAIRELQRALGPERVVAHHVEAAGAALLAGAAPLTFFAHTDLGAELPTYFPQLAGSSFLWSHVGAAIDGLLVHRAQHSLAIAPGLAARLSSSTRAVRAVPPPWPVLPAPTLPRALARRSLGVPASSAVALYVGNLDAYQGWEQVVGAVGQASRTREDLVLLVGTASDATRLRRSHALHGGRSRLLVRPLGDEHTRRLLHGAADVALVPRRAPGGLPIKLLDALARGLPTAATRRALAGLPLHGRVAVVADDDAGAMAATLLTLLEDRPQRERLVRAARHYIATEHNGAAFLTRWDAALAPPTSPPHAEQVVRLYPPTVPRDTRQSRSPRRHASV